jgi:hypothetical protein
MPFEASPKLRPHDSHIPIRPEIRHTWPAISTRVYAWMREALCAIRGHDLQLQIERGRRVYLRCTHCGHETPGWPTR